MPRGLLSALSRSGRSELLLPSVPKAVAARPAGRTGGVWRRGCNFFALLATAGVAFSCSSDATDPVPPSVASVTVTPGSLGLSMGDSGQLTATVRDAAGVVLTGRNVTWTSSQASRATVDGNGLVKAVAAGSSDIVATSEGQHGSASVTVTQPSGLLTGLDFPGNVNFPSPSPSAILTWNQARSGAAPMPAYPATYIWRAYPRPNNNFFQSYWTFLFYARYETTWTQGEVPPKTYYGLHPWPDRETDMEHKWEISAFGDDRTATSGAQGVPVVYNQWYQQVATAELIGGNEVYTYYFNWPNTTTDVIQWTHAKAGTNTDPAIIIGDAPWNQGKEIPNAILRGYQFYDAVLTPAQIAQEIASPGSVRTPWYLNLNPTPGDVSDKSGNGHNPAWVGPVRPGVWTGP